MKKYRHAVARRHGLQAHDLAQVRGGTNGVIHSDLAGAPRDNGVIHIQNVLGAAPLENGIIHMQ